MEAVAIGSRLGEKSRAAISSSEREHTMTKRRLLFSVKEADLRSEIIRIIKLISDDNDIGEVFLPNNSQFMEIRNALKPVFDLEEEINEVKYLGILESAFTTSVQSKIPTMLKEGLSSDDIFNYMAAHPNMQIYAE
jgi:hypothetical protein